MPLCKASPGLRRYQRKLILIVSSLCKHHLAFTEQPCSQETPPGMREFLLCPLTHTSLMFPTLDHILILIPKPTKMIQSGIWWK